MGGLLHGLPFGGVVVSVSHLMFADDCLLLSRANLLMADQIKSIMARYQILSSQCINFSKSSVTFGKHYPVQD